MVAAILFILVWPDCRTRTARHGNLFGIAGMAIALIATIFGPETVTLARSLWRWSSAVQSASVWRTRSMTQMPELVAILHSFVGLAAVLVGFNS
ncbi:NAD(P)(+) transhydrogenase (Re/Si-specific) subunit beta [Shigella flexneri]